MNATVDQRLRYLEDLEEIRGLLTLYGSTLDKRDLLAYSQLFAVDGEWRGGLGAARTPNGIRSMLEAALGPSPSEKYRGAFHVMSNMTISVQGDSATAHSRWTWFVPGDDGAPVAARAGHYDDVLVREAGAWKFKSRVAVTHLRAAAV